MIFLDEYLIDNYNYYMYTLGDPRTSEWFLVKSPLKLLVLLALYLHVCLLAGPTFMKKRQPYHLKNLIMSYNVIQIVLNLHVLKEMVAAMYLMNFDFQCQEIDYSTKSLGLRVLEATWLYLIIKVIDLFSSVFLVFQKKTDRKFNIRVTQQILAVFTSFFIIRFAAGGHSMLAQVLNCSVQIAIYFYYLLSSLGSDYQEYLWWSEYLNQMQFMEFFIVFVHNFQVLFRSCAFPKSIAVLNLVNSIYQALQNE